MVKVNSGPEERWEDQKIWDQERFREDESEHLTKAEIDAIQADEKYDADR
jgi:hypothetical protein